MKDFFQDTQKREHSNHDMVLKREEDIFVEGKINYIYENFSGCFQI
jgi:hypothetical protein